MTHKNTFFALIAGLIFGLGLILAGMTNPSKVLAFLDIAGHWDLSLAFVMAGAIGMSAFAFAWAKKHKMSLLNCPIQLPKTKKVDKPLVFGSLLFGVGWGLAGVCPGPSLVLLGAGGAQGLVFVLAMLAGFLMVHAFGGTQ